MSARLIQLYNAQIWFTAPMAGERSAEVNNAIKEAIRNASSLEEVERLQQMLRVGQIPRK